MKKATKRTMISCIIVIAIAAMAIVGYNIYRRPAPFRHLTDKALEGLFVQADDTDGIMSFLKANGFGE